MSIRISDYCDNRARTKAGERYGIEVEAEGLPVDELMDWSNEYLKHWRTVSDGSLRNHGVEFVSSPLTKSAVPHAVSSLWRYFESGRVHGSVRTGIHIHCNFLGMTTDDVMRVLLHYALLEPQLFKFVGGAREENIYCIPWYRAHDEPTSIGEWLRGSFGGSRRPCKYSAMYVGPLLTFGTIEFRHAPTWHDPETMMQWFRIVQAVYRTHDTTYDVLAEWHKLGPEAFTKSILPFDWLEPASVAEYEAADVETVANLLLPREVIVAPFWGRAPELRTSGNVVTRPVRNTFSPNDISPSISDLITRGPTLTVNSILQGAPATQIALDEYLTDNMAEESSAEYDEQDEYDPPEADDYDEEDVPEFTGEDEVREHF